MLKILFYQNERGESVDDRLVRQKKKDLERALPRRKSMLAKLTQHERC